MIFLHTCKYHVLLFEWRAFLSNQFPIFFFFHSKYNLNLFPQYLAKSNISNHGFWWPCSLLKLEVYKKNLLFIGISVKRPWTRELKIYDSIYSVYTAILIIVSRESSNCNIVYCLSFLLIVFFFLYTLMLYLLCILNMELNDTDEQFYELIFFLSMQIKYFQRHHPLYWKISFTLINWFFINHEFSYSNHYAHSLHIMQIQTVLWVSAFIYA